MFHVEKRVQLKTHAPDLRQLFEGCNREVLRTRRVLVRYEAGMTHAEKAERDRRLREILLSGETDSK